MKATLNKVDLTNINNSEKAQDYPDYLGKPVAYKTISGTIIYHWYEKIEDGEEYDYINKVVNKRYRYEERQKTVQSFSFRTDEKGIASETFTLENPNEVIHLHYLAGWKRPLMNRDVYLSNHYVKAWMQI